MAGSRRPGKSQGVTGTQKEGVRKGHFGNPGFRVRREQTPPSKRCFQVGSQPCVGAGATRPRSRRWLEVRAEEAPTTPHWRNKPPPGGRCLPCWRRPRSLRRTRAEEQQGQVWAPCADSLSAGVCWTRPVAEGEGSCQPVPGQEPQRCPGTGGENGQMSRKSRRSVRGPAEVRPLSAVGRACEHLARDGQQLEPFTSNVRVLRTCLSFCNKRFLSPGWCGSVD